MPLLRRLLCLGATVALIPAMAPAEPLTGPPMDGLHSPAQERLPLPAYRPVPPSEPPPSSEEQQPPPHSARARIVVRHIQLCGNTVFSSSDLAPLTAPFEGREVTPQELETLRRKLTLFYVDHGYVNSGAIIPDQQVGPEGVVTIRIVEGRLTRVEISGQHRLRDEYILGRLQRGLDGPLDMNRLGQNILALDDGPLLRGIKARLRPGSKPGEGVLLTEVEEKDPWRLLFQVANDRSPSIGSERLEADIAHLNLSGWGDTLEVRGSLAEGGEDLEASYSRPLNANDTTLRCWLTRSDSDLVEKPFSNLGISATAETLGLSLIHPTRRTQDQEWSTAITLEHRHGKTFLFDEPFPLFLGSDAQGSATLTVFRLAENFTLRQPNRVVVVRQLCSFGVDALGASTGPEVEPNFLTSLTQVQWAERLGKNGVQLLAKADLQLAPEPLLYLEEYAIGGDATVRGYRENLLLGENGALASLELRLPLGRLPLWTASREKEEGLVQLAPFADWGRVWTKRNDPVESSEKSLASVGLGLRWDPSPTLHAQVYAALPLNHECVAPNGHELQDAGIHFRLVYQAL